MWLPARPGTPAQALAPQSLEFAAEAQDDEIVTPTLAEQHVPIPQLAVQFIQVTTT